MAKKKKTDSKVQCKLPKVRIAQPTGRPFQIRYYCSVEKREIRISTGNRDREEAEKFKAEIEAKLLLGIEIRPEKEKVHGPEMDWSDFREEYRVLHLITLRDKSAQDAESRLDIAERIIKPRTIGKMAETPVLQKLQIQLLAGAQSQNKRTRSPHTVRGYMKAVLAALNWAYRQDWLEKEPKLPRLKVPKGTAMKGRPITDSEFKKMIKAVPEVVGDEATDSWIYVLRGLWESALRIEELMNVSWEQPGSIRPIWNEGEHPVLNIPASMQKNDTHESIPMIPSFESLLLETPPEQRTGWIFNPQSLQLKIRRKVRHSRPEAEWVGRVISRIGKAAGIVVSEADEKSGRPEKYASAHDLRRSFSQRLRNADVPALVISRIMRHSSWETTQKHYAPGNVQNDATTLRNILEKNA